MGSDRIVNYSSLCHPFAYIGAGFCCRCRADLCSSSGKFHKSEAVSRVGHRRERRCRYGRVQKGLFRDFLGVGAETTGLRPATDEIIEIAAIKLTLGDEHRLSIQTLVKPTRRVPSKITRIDKLP